jgi:hypothetical protein
MALLAWGARTIANDSKNVCSSLPILIGREEDGQRVSRGDAWSASYTDDSLIDPRAFRGLMEHHVNTHSHSNMEIRAGTLLLLLPFCSLM